MMCIFLKNGATIEIEAAAAAERRDSLLVLLDEAGQTVQTLDAATVEAYSTDPDIIGAIRDGSDLDPEDSPPSAA